MITMDLALYVFSVISLAQLVYPKPGLIEDATRTFTCPYRAGAVDYLEHDLFAAGVHVHATRQVVFNVKGNRNAHILLKKNRNDYDNDVVEIVLGGWGSQQSVIRNEQQGPAKATNKGPVMSALEYRTFWISWRGQCIKVGNGRRVGEKDFLSWCEKDHTINYISASYGYGSGGKFQFLRTADEISCYSDYRPIGVDYSKHDLFAEGVDIRSSKSIVFSTVARSNAHVLLQKTQNNYTNDVIEIVLGGWHNTKSVIRDEFKGDAKSRYVAEKGKTLDVAEKRYFWISWADNCIKVGRGYSVGKLEMMNWCGLTHDVSYISASYGFGSDGYFQFTQSNPCPKSWILYDRHCYLVVTTTLTWQQSEDNCNQLGAYLTDILDDFENTFVREIGDDAGVQVLWIGLGNYHTVTPPVWTSGRPVSVTYFNTDEPNNIDGVEDCISFTENDRWTDLPCGDQFPSVCKKKTLFTLS